MASGTHSPRLLKLFVDRPIVNGLGVAAGALTVVVGSALIFGAAPALRRRQRCPR